MSIEDTHKVGSVADANATGGAALHPESAAAPAAANPGTSGATTSDTDMNTDNTTQNRVGGCYKAPTFHIISPMNNEPEMLLLNYSKSNPSSSADVHPPIRRQCYYDGQAPVTASGQVDDSVTIVAPGLRYTSPSGATHAFSAEGSVVPAGYYQVSVTHSNIQSHPAGNVSVLTGSVGPLSLCTIVPEDNEEVECDPCSCSCGAASNMAGGTPLDTARAVLPGLAVYPFDSSSGGSGVTRSVNERHMRFAFNFGAFRGMGDIPAGQLELVAFEFSDKLRSSAALSLKHPVASVLVPGSDGIRENEGFCIYDGASYSNYIVSGDGAEIFGVGATAKKSERVHFVTDIDVYDRVICSLHDADKEAKYVRVLSGDGSAMFYNRLTLDFAAYISPNGRRLMANEKLFMVRDNSSGLIRQIWNYWDGVADINHFADGSGYTIDFYLPNQVVTPVYKKQRVEVTGEPFKTFTVLVNAEAQSITIRERDASMPPSMPDYVTTWTYSQGAWSMTTGEGEDAILESREKSPIEGTDQYQVITTLSKGDAVASCVREVFASTVQGELCLSRTVGYGSDGEQTTTFEYDEAGHEVKRTEPDGGVYETVYDSFGRVTVQSSPWAGGQKRLTSTFYREVDTYNSDPAKVVESLVSSSGSVTDIRTEVYDYSENAGVRRVVITTTAAGSTETQTRVEETFLAAGDDAFTDGRPRMTQDVSGLQTHYSYAYSSEHGALYRVTSETRVDDATVPGLSRRKVEFVSAAGNTMRTEEYALAADGETWLLLSGITHTYDVKNRLVSSLRDNGRASYRSLNCAGLLLSETDEDGITTTYGYDTARQLTEIIREEVREGDTRITPETITTYTRDAAGRVLSERKDIGSMTTVTLTAYDLLGREISRTDALGRTTTTAYSADGLTTTVTTPAGATLITTRHADGSTLHLHGTGQQELLYAYDLNNGNQRTTIKLASGAITGQTIDNGFGQTVVEAQAATNNRFIYTRSEYNARGQLVKQYQDTGWNTTPTAPTLFEYDSFGNLTRQTLALAEEPTPANSPITELAYGIESTDEGVFACTTQTRYNATGGLLVSVQKQLISQLSPSLAEKVIAVDERGLTSVDWVVYNNSTKRTRYSSVPTSDITAETVVVDGFTLSQKDTAGIISTATRAYTAGGMVFIQTDGRGNATTTVTDIAGRTLTETDAAGNVTTTVYDTQHDLPAMVTDTMGNTSCYKYDIRGRKVAEWGTALQPACFGYDDADNLVSLKTFRGTPATNEDGSPSQSGEGAAAGDTTTWTFDAATGLELCKTYADNSSVVKTYDAFNRLATETDARGIVKTHSYEPARGLLLGTSYSDDTAPRSFAYNHLGQLTQVTDDAGVRTIGYNAFGEQETDSLLADGKTHLVTELRDSYGRSTGFAYSKDGAVQHSVTTGYGEDGRIATAGFMHGGSEKQFGYTYLPGSHLLQTLTLPCNMTLTQSYETQRNLLIGMAYHRGNTLVTQRSYSYDTLGRPLTRSTNRSGQTVNDSFGYNTRSELTSATVNGSPYGYDYDNIGNRNTATEGEEMTAYAANELNQYTSVGDFAPTFDADGNQALVKTATGIWSVEYNAENRPVRFTSADGATIIECSYDTMGRRATKKVTTNGSITLHQRYIYRGYLQIACCDLTRTAHPALWFITWDPTQPIATRPLAIRKDGTWFAYGWDLTKNICEVFGPAGYIRTAYSYSPYGEVTATGDITQPIQWSSEYNDAELALVYYNYRYYNCTSGNWLNRDMSVSDEYNLYLYVRNRSIDRWDAYGLFLDFLRNSKGELPSFTFEVSSPVPVWGGYPFGVVEIGLPNKEGSQDITIAVGINWTLSKFSNKFLSDKIANKIPKIEIAGFLEGKGSYKCGCFNFCEVSFGAAGSIGSGRRGGRSEGDKNLQGLDTQYTAALGGSFEVRGTVDLCKGEFKGTYTFVLTMGVKAPGFTLIGYGFNPSFEVSFSEEGELWNMPVPELKLFKPCS